MSPAWADQGSDCPGHPRGGGSDSQPSVRAVIPSSPQMAFLGGHVLQARLGSGATSRCGASPAQPWAARGLETAEKGPAPSHPGLRLRLPALGSTPSPERTLRGGWVSGIAAPSLHEAVGSCDSPVPSRVDKNQ